MSLEHDLFAKPASTFSDHSLAALFGVGLKLRLQRRELGEWRIRIGRFLAPLEPLDRRPLAFARRTIGSISAMLGRVSPSIPWRSSLPGMNLSRRRRRVGCRGRRRSFPCGNDRRSGFFGSPRCWRLLASPTARIAMPRARPVSSFVPARPPDFDQDRFVGGTRLLGFRGRISRASVDSGDNGLPRHRRGCGDKFRRRLQDRISCASFSARTGVPT